VGAGIARPMTLSAGPVAAALAAVALACKIFKSVCTKAVKAACKVGKVCRKAKDVACKKLKLFCPEPKPPPAAPGAKPVPHFSSDDVLRARGRRHSGPDDNPLSHAGHMLDKRGAAAFSRCRGAATRPRAHWAAT
jgi:hypothetical protein